MPRHGVRIIVFAVASLAFVARAHALEPLGIRVMLENESEFKNWFPHGGAKAMAGRIAGQLRQSLAGSCPFHHWDVQVNDTLSTATERRDEILQQVPVAARQKRPVWNDDSTFVLPVEASQNDDLRHATFQLEYDWPTTATKKLAVELLVQSEGTDTYAPSGFVAYLAGPAPNAVRLGDPKAGNGSARADDHHSLELKGLRVGV